MDQLVNFIIRPPRADYSPNDDLLEQEFMLKGRWFQRKDLEEKKGTTEDRTICPVLSLKISTEVLSLAQTAKPAG